MKIKKEIKQELITDGEGVKVKKKRDRFHGMPEEEVAKRTLPDLLVPDLDICIVSSAVCRMLCLIHVHRGGGILKSFCLTFIYQNLKLTPDYKTESSKNWAVYLIFIIKCYNVSTIV